MEVVAGACRAFLCSEWEAHTLDLSAKGVQGAQDLLNVFVAVHEFGTCGIGWGSLVILREHLTGIDGTLRLFRDGKGQGLDDITRRSLKKG